MILKVRSLSEGFTVPEPVTKDGLLTVQLDPAGELVKVPAKYVDACERIVGNVAAGEIFPVGIELQMDSPHDALNGFWVQREIYDHVKKVNGAAAA